MKAFTTWVSWGQENWVPNPGFIFQEEVETQQQIERLMREKKKIESEYDRLQVSFLSGLRMARALVLAGRIEGPVCIGLGKFSVCSAYVSV